MSVVATNLALGPGTLYTGVFGAVEPLDTAVATTPDATAWPDVGGTKDGVSIAINQEFTELDVDQIVDVVGRRMTKRDLTMQTNMAEVTLENLVTANNGGTIAIGGTGATAFKSYVPSNDTSATQPVYKALVMDAFGPNSKRRRLLVRRVLSTSNLEFAYKENEQTVYTTTFAAHFVSSSITPFKIVDEVGV